MKKTDERAGHKRRAGLNKNLKMVLVTIIALVGLFAMYRLIFIRTVNYEIGGIIIPSQYNALTGKATPITGYPGKSALPSVEGGATGNLGLSEEQVLIAKLRWAIFEKWANSHPEYKGWETNAEIFKKAHDAFRKELESYGPRFKIVK